MANVEKFKYWCNKILPLVYDDSLSYYEFLGKVYEKMNETIDAVNDNTAAIAEFDQRINDFIQSETQARESWEDQQERDRQSWETQQAQKWAAFQAMFISEYDPDVAYVKGDLCSVQYKMYVANASTTGTFDPTKWDEIVLSDYLADYVSTAAAAMQAQYDAFLNDYQRTFGIVDYTSNSATDAISSDAVNDVIGYNLIDYDKLIQGGFYSKVDGSWTANALLMTTDLIRIRPGQTIYTWYNNDNHFNNTWIMYYNENGEFVTSQDTADTETVYTVPANNNIKYCRFIMPILSATNNYKPRGFYTAPAAAILDYTRNDGLHKEIKKLPIVDMLYSLCNGNLINPQDSRNLTGGLYSQTGEWTVNANFTSLYIPLKNLDGQLLYFFYNGSAGYPATPLTFWDDDDQHLIKGYASADASEIKPIPFKTKEGYRVTHAYVVVNNNNLNKITAWLEQITAHRSQYTLAMAKNDINYILEHAEDLSPGRQWNNKTWYAYGTSITSIEVGKYVTPLANMLSLTAVNKGIGGGGIGDLGAYSRGQVYDAICNVTDGKLAADLITLETGANDVVAGVPLGTIYDTGRATLAGCLNDCIRYLQTNTDAQVVIIESPTSNVQPEAANQWWTWRLMMRDICAINNVTFVPIESNVGYAKMVSASGSDYIVDNIHQTELGGYVYAEAIFKYLKNVPTFKTSIPNS